MRCEADRKSSRKRPPIVAFVIRLMIGLFGLHRVTQSAQFESYSHPGRHPTPYVWRVLRRLAYGFDVYACVAARVSQNLIGAL
jgi:hypothetical protein